MPDGRQHAMPMPRARLGRWSIVTAIIALALLAAGAVGVVMIGNERTDPPSTITLVTTVAALWLSRLFNLIGVVLGVIGLARQGADRYLGGAGVVLNVAMVFAGPWIAYQLVQTFAGS